MAARNLPKAGEFADSRWRRNDLNAAFGLVWREHCVSPFAFCTHNDLTDNDPRAKGGLSAEKGRNGGFWFRSKGLGTRVLLLSLVAQNQHWYAGMRSEESVVSV